MKWLRRGHWAIGRDGNWIQLLSPSGRLFGIGKMDGRVFEFQRKVCKGTKYEQPSHGVSVLLLGYRKQLGNIQWLHLTKGPDGKGGQMSGWISTDEVFAGTREGKFKVERHSVYEEQVFIPIQYWKKSKPKVSGK